MKKMINNKDEKITAVLKKMKEKFSLPDFVEEFKKNNPKDYDKLNKRFLSDEKNVRITNWKKQAMPTPEIYLFHALKDYIRANPESLKKLSENNFKKIAKKPAP
jgi:hypothetical protein